MKHDDTTLQAAIDAAMLELGTGNQYSSLDTYLSKYWPEEATARLALAKAFLAKLDYFGESNEMMPQPILAEDGRSLGQVAKEAFIGAPGLTDDWMNAATMRCVTAISKIEDLVTTDHESKESFIARVREILGHNDQAI